MLALSEIATSEIDSISAHVNDFLCLGQERGSKTNCQLYIRIVHASFSEHHMFGF